MNFKFGDKVVYTGPDLRHLGKTLTIVEKYNTSGNRLLYVVKELPHFTPLEYNLRYATKLDEVLA